jgi:hypothetical protein
MKKNDPITSLDKRMRKIATELSERIVNLAEEEFSSVVKVMSAKPNWDYSCFVLKLRFTKVGKLRMREEPRLLTNLMTRKIEVDYGYYHQHNRFSDIDFWSKKDLRQILFWLIPRVWRKHTTKQTAGMNYQAILKAIVPA